MNTGISLGCTVLCILLQCNNGWAGNGYLCGDDPDQDGVPTLGLPCSEEECKSVMYQITVT